MTRSVFSNEYEKFRLQLIQARKSVGLTQTQLAKKLSRPQSYVSKYERGERRIDVVELIEVTRALDIDPIKFFKNLNEIL